jgi:polyisoprenoid-binding protein YceI
MLKFLLLSALLIAVPPAVHAESLTPPDQMPAGLYQSDASHTSLTWRVSHLGLSQYTARFTKVDAKLDYNPQDPTQSKLTARVDPTSIKTDFPDPAKKDFDHELGKGKDWLNGEIFPAITYSSTKIIRTGDNTADIHGDLTLLGITKPLVLKARFNGAYLKKPFTETPALGFSATGTIKRSDWGLKTHLPMIGDEVELLIETEFNQEPKIP